MHEREAPADASMSLLLPPPAQAAPTPLHKPDLSPEPDPEPDSDPEHVSDSGDATACRSLLPSPLLPESLPSLPLLPAVDCSCAREAPGAASAPADPEDSGLDPAQELALLGELDGEVAEVAFVDVSPAPPGWAVPAAAPCMSFRV